MYILDRHWRTALTEGNPLCLPVKSVFFLPKGTPVIEEDIHLIPFDMQIGSDFGKVKGVEGAEEAEDQILLLTDVALTHF